MNKTLILQALISLSQQLISCPSITPNDAGCQKIICHQLEEVGFSCEYIHAENVDNLWATYGKEAPLVVFAGHTDVVPPGPEKDWTTNPFQPEIKNGVLYGRGAADMKGALAAMVIAAKNFVKTNPDFKGSIGFLITSDEEGPSINGTKKVIEILSKRHVKIDYCVIGEASSEKQIGDQIRVGRRGSLHGKLTLFGKQGHVAYPRSVINPIHNSFSALNELANHEWDNGNENFPATTFQITNINAGTGATNVVPGQLDTLFNFRFSTASTANDLEEKTEKILQKYHLNYNIEWKLGAEPFLTRKGRLIEVTQKAIKEITDLDTQLSTGGGTSDGRFISPTGAEVVELGVLNETAHQINEHVSVNELETLEQIYERILSLLLENKSLHQNHRP